MLNSLDNFTIKKVAFSLYYIIVIFLSLTNYSDIDNFKLFYKYDKVIHFMQYFLLILFSINVFNIAINARNFFIILLFIMASSFSIEWFQSYIPGRDSNSIDTIYDISGGITAFFIFLGIRYAAKFNN